MIEQISVERFISIYDRDYKAKIYPVHALGSPDPDGTRYLIFSTISGQVRFILPKKADERLANTVVDAMKGKAVPMPNKLIAALGSNFH